MPASERIMTTLVLLAPGGWGMVMGGEGRGRILALKTSKIPRCMSHINTRFPTCASLPSLLAHMHTDDRPPLLNKVFYL